MRAGLFHHFDQDLSGFFWIAYLSQKSDAGTSHAILGFQADMKPEAIDCDHGCFLRFDVSKFSGEQDERILVIGVHMLNDLGRRIRKRVGRTVLIFRSRYPAHHSEAAHVIDVDYVHAVKGKVFEIHPILAIGVTQ